MSHKTEYYYAIRIGDPRRNDPYFMLESGKKVPALFATKKDADYAFSGLTEQSGCRVVRVAIRAG